MKKQNQVSSLKKEWWQIAPRKKNSGTECRRKKSTFNGAWRSIQEHTSHDDTTVAFMSVSNGSFQSLRAAKPQNRGAGVRTGSNRWSNPTWRSLTGSQMRHLRWAGNNLQFRLICQSSAHRWLLTLCVWNMEGDKLDYICIFIRCCPSFPLILWAKFPQPHWE